MDDTLQIESITGVDLNLKIAGPGGRSYAFVIDWHIRLLLALAWLVAGTVLYSGGLTFVDTDAASSSGYVFAVILPATAIYFLYHPVVELAMAGRTPGKRMANIRIVTQTGEVPGAGALLVRNVLRLVDSLPGFYAVGLVTTMLTEQSVRLGDMAAGTLLVYDEESTVADFESVSPDAVAAVGLENLQLARELIERWPDLDPATRLELGQKFLSRVDQAVPATDEAVLLALQRLVSR